LVKVAFHLLDDRHRIDARAGTHVPSTNERKICWAHLLDVEKNRGWKYRPPEARRFGALQPSSFFNSILVLVKVLTLATIRQTHAAHASALDTLGRAFAAGTVTTWCR
jgi:hypothetical protein